MKVKIGKYPKKSDKQRKVKIQVSDHDVWSADSTLALIIVPVLKKLKEAKAGHSFIDQEDYPAEILGGDPHDPENPDHRPWEWALDEMIWAFEQHATDDWDQQYYSGETDYIWEPIEGSTNKKLVMGPNDTFTVDREGLDKHRARMANGRRLFAKYYGCLWT